MPKPNEVCSGRQSYSIYRMSELIEGMRALKIAYDCCEDEFKMDILEERMEAISEEILSRCFPTN